MTGRTCRRETVSLMGTMGWPILRKYNLQDPASLARMLSFPEPHQDVARGGRVSASWSCVRQVVALIDATKWGRVGPASFACPQDCT